VASAPDSLTAVCPEEEEKRRGEESGLLHTFFINSRAFNNNVISNGKSYCYNDTFSDVQFSSLLAKNI